MNQLRKRGQTDVKHHRFIEAAVLDKQPSATVVPGQIRRIITAYWSEAVVIVVAFLLWVPRFSGPIDLRWDAGVYYLLGTSLANGQGYRIQSEPGSPEALQYPPLLPAVVALHQRVVGTNDPAVVAPLLRIMYAVVFGIYAVAIVALAKRYLRPAFAATAAIFCLLNPVTIFLSDLLFAELPFALLGVLFALVAGGSSHPSRQWLREAGSFLLAALGFLLRAAGIVLLAAWVLQAVMWQRWRLALARAALALLPIIGWQTHVAHVHGTVGYSHPAYEYQRAPYQYYNVSYVENMLLVDPFRPELGKLNVSTLASRILTNVLSVPGAMGEIVSAKEKDWRGTVQWIQGLVFGQALFPAGLVRLPIFALAGLVIAGLMIFVCRRDWLMAFIVLGSFGLFCITPWPGQFTRYLEPLAPFLTIALLLGLCQITTALSARGIQKTPMIAASAFLVLLTIVVEIHKAVWLFGERARQRVVFAREEIGPESKWFIYDRSWQAWQQAVNWIDSRAPRNALVATTAPYFYYLQTGRLAVLPPMEADLVRERGLLDSVPVSYVIIDELEFTDIARRYVFPAVEADRAGWHLVYKIDSTTVYERGTPSNKSTSDTDLGS
jgi:hypothetical protein